MLSEGCLLPAYPVDQHLSDVCCCYVSLVMAVWGVLSEGCLLPAYPMECFTSHGS